MFKTDMGQHPNYLVFYCSHSLYFMKMTTTKTYYNKQILEFEFKTSSPLQLSTEPYL